MEEIISIKNPKEYKNNNNSLKFSKQRNTNNFEQIVKSKANYLKKSSQVKEKKN